MSTEVVVDEAVCGGDRDAGEDVGEDEVVEEQGDDKSGTVVPAEFIVVDVQVVVMRDGGGMLMEGGRYIEEVKVEDSGTDTEDTMVACCWCCFFTLLLE